MLMRRPGQLLPWGQYTKATEARMTFVENKLYLEQSEWIEQCELDSAYESVRKPDAATPQIRRFHELRSSS